LMSIVTPSGVTMCVDVFVVDVWVGVGDGDAVAVAVAVGVGEVVGAGAELLVVIDSLAERWFPDVSVARAMMVWEPFERPVVSSDLLQLEVPEAAAKGAPSIETSTRSSPTLSEAVPETVTDPLTVEPAAGPAIATDGAVVSVVEQVPLRLQDPFWRRASAPGRETAASTAITVVTMTVERRTKVEAERISQTPRPFCLSKAHTLCAARCRSRSGVHPLRS
jgi:hypothetical protein